VQVDPDDLPTSDTVAHGGLPSTMGHEQPQFPRHSREREAPPRYGISSVTSIVCGSRCSELCVGADDQAGAGLLAAGRAAGGRTSPGYLTQTCQSWGHTAHHQGQGVSSATRSERHGTERESQL
jgi:hypothetical protein